MSYPKEMPQTPFIDMITQYIRNSSGLAVVHWKDHLELSQKLDDKCLIIPYLEIQKVIQRMDAKGASFLQVNYHSSQKILLTDSLVGFRPVPIPLLDMSYLPKVVTTQDIQSVFEVIQETLQADFQGVLERGFLEDDPLQGVHLVGGANSSGETSRGETPGELDTLRRVFDSVIRGGEKVGFNLSRERDWFHQIPLVKVEASA